MNGELVQAVKALDSANALSPVSLDLSDSMTFERYEALGRMLGLLKRATSWWIGDYLLFGEATYGERYAQAASATGLSQQTLLNYAWVARNVPKSRRRPGVPFSVHEAVAALAPREQRRWLARAEREDLTQRELRELIREEKAMLAGEPAAADTNTGSGQEASDADRDGARRNAASNGGSVGGGSLPSSYVIPGPLCRRLVEQAQSGVNGWVQVPRSDIEQLAALIGEED